MKFLGVLLLIISSSIARKGFGPGEQDWGYVELQPGSNMFWWLYQTTADVENYTDKPLIIWLQGGPGASSTGLGNFGEIGSLDQDLEPRESAWTKNYNVLFVDSPVGTGFSYVDSSKKYPTTNRKVAEDFLVFLQGFYAAVPELKKTPLYIFCESYGGKMAIEIALVVDQAVKAGTFDTKLIGVGLGDSWISPFDSVATWGPYLYSVGAIDKAALQYLQDNVDELKGALEDGNYNYATDLWGQAESLVLYYTSGIDFYNILTKTHWFSKREGLIRPGVAEIDDYKISEIMNNQVKEALGLNNSWNAQDQAVFNNLYEDFMKPVTDIVEEVLNTTDIRVAVYNGQLDLIVDTLGTTKWVDALKFDGSAKWPKASRDPIVVQNIIEGYKKRVGKLTYYWVDRAGHMVPADNPNAMEFILNDVINGNW